MKPNEFGNGRAGAAPETPAVTLPVACPVCQSRSISTTARKPDESAYWRCDSCGEIWNAGRRETAGRRRPWR